MWQVTLSHKRFSYFCLKSSDLPGGYCLSCDELEEFLRQGWTVAELQTNTFLCSWTSDCHTVANVPKRNLGLKVRGGFLLLVLETWNFAWNPPHIFRIRLGGNKVPTLSENCFDLTFFKENEQFRPKNELPVILAHFFA